MGHDLFRRVRSWWYEWIRGCVWVWHATGVTEHVWCVAPLPTRGWFTIQLGRWWSTLRPFLIPIGMQCRNRGDWITKYCSYAMQDLLLNRRHSCILPCIIFISLLDFEGDGSALEVLFDLIHSARSYLIGCLKFQFTSVPQNIRIWIRSCWHSSRLFNGYQHTTGLGEVDTKTNH